MIQLLISGINGKMGRMICSRACCADTFKIVGGFDTIADPSCNVFTKPKDINITFDAVLDFSRPEALDDIISIASTHNKPCVLATTGYTDKQVQKIQALSKKVPVFLSGNMSVGIHVMQKLVESAVKNLWGCFDIEVIEKHHNQKVDAPSGTAKMLENTIASASNGQAKFLYGREGNHTKRQPNEVTVHAIRGGTIVGEHEVHFCGNGEVITISHSALSRTIFADGALKAVEFLITKKAGLYTMTDLVDSSLTK